MNTTHSTKETLQANPRRLEAEYDWATTPPSTAVIESLAGIREIDQLEMEPLYPAIDLDAVDALLPRDRETGLRIMFTVTGFRVTLTASGLVRIQPEEEEAAES